MGITARWTNEKRNKLMLETSTDFKRCKNVENVVPPKSFPEPVYVTRPMLPDIHAVRERVEAIWASEWLTNHVAKHNALQALLQTRLLRQRLTQWR
jgi:hypothetical protein